jgi:hypothetical protein
MIAIVNKGPHDPEDPHGWRTYEVRINSEVITTFRHKRSEGLGKCLLEASEAVERQKWRDAARILGGCRHDAGHELNGVGMWICNTCRADITLDSNPPNASVSYDA